MKIDRYIGGKCAFAGHECAHDERQADKENDELERRKKPLDQPSILKNRAARALLRCRALFDQAFELGMSHGVSPSPLPHLLDVLSGASKRG